MKLQDPTTLAGSVSAVVIRGHGVASGKNGDPRFPGGTLGMQLSSFKEAGLDLDDFHLATLNLSIAPCRYSVRRAPLTFREVRWHPSEPAEDFSFFDAAVRKGGTTNWVPALIYYPHPETKPEHFQPTDMLEVIAKEEIPGVSYGTGMELAFDPEQLFIEHQR